MNGNQKAVTNILVMMMTVKWAIIYRITKSIQKAAAK